MIRKIVVSVFMIVLSTSYLKADSPSRIISLADAEKIFLKNNPALLAAKYNIDIAKAASIQAKLWSNPNISIGQNIYNQNTQKWLDFTATGNTDIAIQQLIILGNKRDKQLKYIDQTALTVESQYFELLRNLKYELRKAYFGIVFAERSLEFCDSSIAIVSETVDKTSKSFEKGAVIMSELLRLKSLLMSLQAERTDYVTAIESNKATLRLILGDSAVSASDFSVSPEFYEHEKNTPDSRRISDLFKTGIEARPDVATAKSIIKADEFNIDYQHSLAVPDLSVGGSWSRAGSYIPNYFAITASIDIPVFNKNQGNIEVAQLTLQSDKLNSQIAEKRIQSEIATAYAKLQSIAKTIRSIDPTFSSNYKDYIAKMFDGYDKRNVTIIELTDFYESYRSSIMLKNKLLGEFNDAVEELNFAVGTDVFRVN